MRKLKKRIQSKQILPKNLKEELKGITRKSSCKIS
tara:strand:+ start:355 stop:459 length:105 start_codon:yes stop_codon:yes gene_type:complete